MQNYCSDIKDFVDSTAVCIDKLVAAARLRGILLTDLSISGWFCTGETRSASGI